MTAFKSKWADWEPDTLSQRSAKSDKRASGTLGTSSPKRISEKNVGPDLDVTPPDAPTPRSAKSDKRGDGDQFAFEERAAILQFDGGFSREEAERRAAVEVFGGPR